MFSARTIPILALFILLPAVVFAQSTRLTLTADAAGVGCSCSALNPTAIFHAQIDTSSGSSQPAGYASLSYTIGYGPTSFVWFQSKQATASGRIYAETTPGDLGVAFTNPNGQAVTVTFFFTDANGSDFGNGSFSLPPQGQLARFITEAPYNAPAGFQGTLTYMASEAIAVIAVRGLINPAGLFLMPEVPVAEFGGPATTIVPDFIDGTLPIMQEAAGPDVTGTFTELILVNVTDNALTGSFTFYGSSSDTTTTAQPTAVTINGQTIATFPYTIPPRSSRRFVTAGNSMQGGSIHIQPDATSPSAPQAFSISNFIGPISVPVTTTPGVITFETFPSAPAYQATIPGQAPGTAFRLPLQCPARVGLFGVCASEIAMAITNPSSTDASISFDSPGLNVSSTMTVPGNGLITVYPEELNSALLSTAYDGTIRVSSSSPISVIGLQSFRGTSGYVAIPPFAELSTPPTLFPHLAINGGYTASLQLIKTVDTQPSTATVDFFSPSGSALDPTAVDFNETGSLRVGTRPEMNFARRPIPR